MKGEIVMTVLMVIFFFVLLVFLNILSFQLFKKSKINLILSGIILIMLAPVIGVSSGALFVRLNDLNSVGTGEGAGFGSTILGLITAANGILILLIGITLWAMMLVQKR